MASREALEDQAARRDSNGASSVWAVRAVWALTVIAAMFSVKMVVLGFHHSLLDFHGFRQTQTAISVWSLLTHWNLIKYETPVLGPPWSLPFEFPLYQGIVALLVHTFGWPIDETGRGVSIAFFYLSFLPIISILRKFRFQAAQIASVLAIFAVSPVYIFWSRTFMIESTALFFSLLYLDQVISLVRSESTQRWWTFAGACLFGAIAALVKVTTFAPYLILGTGLVLYPAWRAWRRSKPSLPQAIKSLLVVTLIPTTLAVAWTKYADAEKSKNPFGIFFVSHSLQAWNFGTLTQRLHWQNYLDVAHGANLHIGSRAVVALIVVAYAIVLRRWNVIALVAVGMYVLQELIFFNLYIVHEYYPYSSALFLIVAVGALISDMIDLTGKRAWLGTASLALVLLACALRYRDHYYGIQWTNAPGRPAAARVIDTTTSADSVILVSGLGWSSEFPYQSHRRAITDPFPGREGTQPGSTPIIEAIENEGPQNIAAVVVCADQPIDDRVNRMLLLVGMAHNIPEQADDCKIYERTPTSMPR